MGEPITVTKQNPIDELSKELHFEISEAGNVDLECGRYTKLELGSEQKMQMSMLMSQMPAMLACNELAGSYKVVFPEGVQGTLTKLKKGGYGTMIKDLQIKVKP